MLRMKPSFRVRVLQFIILFQVVTTTGRSFKLVQVNPLFMKALRAPRVITALIPLDGLKLRNRDKQGGSLVPSAQVTAMGHQRSQVQMLVLGQTCVGIMIRAPTIR